LLEQAGLTFTVIPSTVDESRFEATAPEDYARVLAEAKAEDIAERHPGSWVIGADTIVLIDGTILGKPASRDEARSMLWRLGGQTHEVITGYCICCRELNIDFSETATTRVRFKDLSEREIEWYIHTEEPFDKAGAYAIQGLGTFLVKSIHGSYTIVVGLRVCEVIEFLIKEKVIRYGK
jgi:septum formation protein